MHHSLAQVHFQMWIHMSSLRGLCSAQGEVCAALALGIVTLRGSSSSSVSASSPSPLLGDASPASANASISLAFMLLAPGKEIQSYP